MTTGVKNFEKQFLELCIQLLQDIEKSVFMAIISKYDEILSICEKCMPEMLPKTPVNAEEARTKRQTYIGILQRCKELEEEALKIMGSVVLKKIFPFRI